jgi:energy-coupling factor transport system substrate-specific component
LMRRLRGELVRFATAGSLASATNWLVRLVTSLVVPFSIALIIGAGVGLAIGFVLYRTWVFPGSTLGLPLQTIRFMAVNAVSACVVIALALVIAPLLTGFPISTLNQQNLAHAIAIGFGATINFIGHRRFTFQRKPAASELTALDSNTTS